MKGGRDLKDSQSYPRKLLDPKDMFSLLFLYHLSLYQINIFLLMYPTRGPFTQLQIRLGTAMSKLRTKFLKSHKLRAQQFLRQAAKDTSRLNSRASINQMFIDGANLEPMLSFLSK